MSNLHYHVGKHGLRGTLDKIWFGKNVMKAKNNLKRVLCLASLLLLSACTASDRSFLRDLTWFSGEQKFLDSGTIILSHQVPSKSAVASNKPAPIAEEVQTAGADKKEIKKKQLAPLVGYFPPAPTYLPADNETWLEINQKTKVLTLYKGKGVVKEMHSEGNVSIATGDYYLQHKQKQPLWYAPNEYFAKRQLSIPSSSDRLRYRRGALGQFALFPTTTFPIHCAPLWTEDVGGLRLSATDLASIYYMLPVGAPIVVK